MGAGRDPGQTAVLRDMQYEIEQKVVESTSQSERALSVRSVWTLLQEIRSGHPLQAIPCESTAD